VKNRTDKYPAPGPQASEHGYIPTGPPARVLLLGHTPSAYTDLINLFNQILVIVSTTFVRAI
jgi:hypothetical protein